VSDEPAQLAVLGIERQPQHLITRAGQRGSRSAGLRRGAVGAASRARVGLPVMAFGGPLRRAFGVITRTGLHARAEDAIQGKHEVVAGLQCVRQDGPGRAGLAESGGHDQGPVPARLVPGCDENASAGGLRAAGLETGDPVLAQQRVVVADHAGHGNDGRGLAAIAASTGTRAAGADIRSGRGPESAAAIPAWAG
jgi:hypothetical protein